MSDANISESTPRVLTEIQSGDGLEFAAAGRLFPGHRGSKSVDPSTVYRWATKGTKTADARTVRLEAVRVGSRWLTSRAAITRFVSALTAAADRTAAPVQAVPRAATVGEQSEGSRKAMERLKAAGA